LVQGWDEFPYNSETVDYGTGFLRKKEHLALKVPSVIIPDEFNVILNPLHPDIQKCVIIISETFAFQWFNLNSLKSKKHLKSTF
jgi:RES domain-containing protein